MSAPPRGCASPALVVDDGDDPAELPRLVAARGARLVVVTALLPPARLRALCATARAVGARVGVAPASPESADPDAAGGAPDAAASARPRIPSTLRTEVCGVDVLLLPARGKGRGAGADGPGTRAFQRALDLAAVALLALVAAPMGLVAAATIRADSPGPVFFVQERVGRDGRRFRMWKFRTMRADAPPYARSPGDADPRVTRVGRLLRPAGLDELPQLLNVLRGEMRLVGPRPEMPFVVERYTALERERLRATPGITGLWQLCGDRARPIHEQLAYDFAYIACASPALDARILLGTAGHAARAVGAALRGALGARAAAGAAAVPRPDAAP